MTYLDEILDPALLGQMMDEGYVQVRYHPDYPFAIYCYTKQAMFDREWNDVTKVCRGLIVNEDTGEVLARPFRKFFNHGEPSAPIFDPKDLVEVTDKLDGSLGILYKTPDGLAIATKGSFTSEQAKWATEHLRAKYGPTEWEPISGVTYLFEIIYPENRIVLDYGDLEAIRLLATIDIKTGRDVELDIYHDPFAYQDYFGRGQFGFVVGNVIRDRPNREGFVLRRLKDDERLKFKQADYIELHKVMTGLNEKQLWEWLSEGKEVDQILRDLPEELHDWASPILENLNNLYLEKIEDIYSAYVTVWKIRDRKEFAQAVKDFDPWIKGAMFMMKDKNDDRLVPYIWKSVKP